MWGYDQFDQVRTEEDFFKWREVNKWRIKYELSRRGEDVAHAVVWKVLSRWHGSDSFPLKTLPYYHGAHDAASIGCWDVFDHYIKKMNQDLEEANLDEPVGNQLPLGPESWQKY
jgi:hypothetical protein